MADEYVTIPTVVHENHAMMPGQSVNNPNAGMVMSDNQAIHGQRPSSPTWDQTVTTPGSEQEFQ